MIDAMKNVRDQLEETERQTRYVENILDSDPIEVEELRAQIEQLSDTVVALTEAVDEAWPA